MTDVVQPSTTAQLSADVVQPTTTAPEGPEYTATEQEAMKYGWKPKEQWEGESDDFRPAKEFMERASFFKKINDLNRKLDQTSGALQAMQQHHQHVYTKAYDQAIADLKVQHKEAVEAGDLVKAEGLVDQITDTRDQKRIAQQTAQARPAPQDTDIQEFMERNNTWYQADDVMTAYADRIGFERANADVNAGRRPDPLAVLKYVESKVREKFPDRFGSQKRAAPNPVGGSGSPAGRPRSTTKHAEADLPEDAKKVMNQLLKSKVPGMTKERYIKEYFGDKE